MHVITLRQFTFSRLSVIVTSAQVPCSSASRLLLFITAVNKTFESPNWFQLITRLSLGIITPSEFISHNVANEAVVEYWFFSLSHIGHISKHNPGLWWRSSKGNWPIPSTKLLHVPVETYFFCLLDRYSARWYPYSVCVCIDPVVCCSIFKRTALCVLSHMKWKSSLAVTAVTYIQWWKKVFP